MGKLKKWLETTVANRAIPLLIFVTIIVIVLYNFSFLFVILSYFPTYLDGPNNVGKIPSDFSIVNALEILGYVAVEEWLFRLMPFYIMYYYRDHLTPLLVVLTLGIVIYFGYIHGGVRYIPIQGASALALTVVFMKTGFWEGKLVKAFCCSTACHFLWNISVVLLVKTFG